MMSTFPFRNTQGPKILRRDSNVGRRLAGDGHARAGHVDARGSGQVCAPVRAAGHSVLRVYPGLGSPASLAALQGELVTVPGAQAEGEPTGCAYKTSLGVSTMRSRQEGQA